MDQFNGYDVVFGERKILQLIAGDQKQKANNLSNQKPTTFIFNPESLILQPTIPKT
jgi:hypothetical protein